MVTKTQIMYTLTDKEETDHLIKGLAHWSNTTLFTGKDVEKLKCIFRKIFQLDSTQLLLGVQYEDALIMYIPSEMNKTFVIDNDNDRRAWIVELQDKNVHLTILTDYFWASLDIMA